MVGAGWWIGGGGGWGVVGGNLHLYAALTIFVVAVVDFLHVLVFDFSTTLANLDLSHSICKCKLVSAIAFVAVAAKNAVTADGA